MYKLAFVVPSGKSTRLWMCDWENGARTITLNDQDVVEVIVALLGEDWEPFGIGLEGCVWFRKADGHATSEWHSKYHAVKQEQDAVKVVLDCQPTRDK